MHYSRSKFTQIRFRPGLRLGPRWRSYDVPQTLYDAPLRRLRCLDLVALGASLLKEGSQLQ